MGSHRDCTFIVRRSGIAGGYHCFEIVRWYILLYVGALQPQIKSYELIQKKYFITCWIYETGKKLEPSLLD